MSCLVVDIIIIYRFEHYFIISTVYVRKCGSLLEISLTIMGSLEVKHYT